ncbi:hypothetical protein STCU_11779 [Strigomonas culicis]|uniref:Uncharacterized protein n=1 Tax=Strigomonas culicis TaxID=28005 RepID=S9TCL7_9TRYP|nr:hypothetical protein STCU_11779 [Strigomonas culicis]|eukprot:EPY15772.1 hypothetical protein STCU_11779 [Strigomonas culicis]
MKESGFLKPARLVSNRRKKCEAMKKNKRLKKNEIKPFEQKKRRNRKKKRERERCAYGTGKYYFSNTTKVT